MRVPLTLGSYQTRSIIAEAQRCLNLFGEANPQDAPFPYTFYPTPGLASVASGTGEVRCLWRAQNGTQFAVIGSKVYTVDSAWNLTQIGTIGGSTGIVSMSDNGLVAVIVNGTSSGWCIRLSDNAFAAISATNFYGGDKVDYVDTYFLFNRPDTNEWYFTLSEADYAMLTGGTAFDPLDIAAKVGAADDLSTLIVVHREIWLIGTALSAEVWYNAGASDFTFQEIPGAFIEHGCVAKHSAAKWDLDVFWLSRDRTGTYMVLRGRGYAVGRISTHPIEKSFASYGDVSDATGFTYMQEGHSFYALTFPSASRTWVFDISEQQWHERGWSNSDGVQFRWRPNCAALFNGVVVVGDYANGKLYRLDLDTYTDDGAAIVRLRSFPHLVSEQKRLITRSLIVDMEVGQPDGDDGDAPEVNLRWSDTRGQTWGNPVTQSIGDLGEFLTSVQWNRLGMARDRVYEISWSAPMKTALSGVYLEVIPAGS